jgi:hypothetical protein
MPRNKLPKLHGVLLTLNETIAVNKTDEGVDMAGVNVNPK